VRANGDFNAQNATLHQEIQKLDTAQEAVRRKATDQDLRSLGQFQEPLEAYEGSPTH
jgi:hypothetical protein